MTVLQIYLYRIEAGLGPNETSIHLATPKTCTRCIDQRWSIKKAVLKSFAKFTGKHLYQSVFFDKIAAWTPAFLLKRECSRSTFM